MVDLQNFRVFLSDEQVKIQRGLREAFVINGMGDLILRGNRSYLFDYEPPSAQDFTAALTEVLLIEDQIFHQISPSALPQIKVTFESMGCRVHHVLESEALPSAFVLSKRQFITRIVAN